MAASGFQHLTLDERRSLFRMQEAQLGVTEMVVRLCKSALGFSADQRYNVLILLRFPGSGTCDD